MILQNQHLTAVVTEKGAVVESIQKDGKEFFWQKDAAVWELSDLVMFPFVARLPEEKYYLERKQYRLPIHGFCVGTAFRVEECTDTRVVFSLTDSEETRKIYPFPFRFFVEYSLEENALVKRYRVETPGRKPCISALDPIPGSACRGG